MPKTRLLAGAVACEKCSQNLRIVPSTMYGHDDVALFEELSATLREGNVTAIEAMQLAAELKRVLANHSYDRFFDILSTKTPGFTPIQLLYGGKPSHQLRALRMLSTILDALAAGRSGTMRAVKAPLVPLAAGTSSKRD
jgi:hypothetical protein